MTKTGEEIYSGLATFGKIEAVIGAIVATIIGIILVIVGIVLIRHRSNLKGVEGIVIQNSQCSTNMQCGGNNCTSHFSCTTDVKYTFDGKLYTEKISTGNSTYSSGDKIVVYLDPNNPSQAEGIPSPKWIGWVIIGVGFVILISSWTWVYITRKSKVAAAVGGAAAGINMIGNAVRF
jgi:hypothetical protein